MSLTWSYPRANVGNCTRTVGFFKALSAPSGDTTLFDWDFGVSGFWRVKLTSTLHVFLEVSLLGDITNVDINGGVAVTANSWFYIHTYSASPNGNGNLVPYGQVEQVGVTRTGGAGQVAIGSGGSFVGRLGIGYPASNAYLEFTGEISKVEVYDLAANTGPPAAPTTDPSPTGQVFLMARETVGAAVDIDDTSGNNNHAIQAGATLTINIDGPYP